MVRAQPPASRGTDLAIESAGVILIGDRLEDVRGALILGKASYRTMTGNVVVAAVFNVVGMFLAALGFITPSFAILVMVVSIFVILLNTLRVRRLDLGREEAAESGALAEVEFLVPSMVCEGCAARLRSALGSLPGVHEVRPKVERKHVYVRYELEKLEERALVEAIARAGFLAIAA